MKLRQIINFLWIVILVLCLTSGKKQTTVFVIGDSTAAEKKDPAIHPERGWGMMLQGFFDEDILVRNHAVNGRSSKSFMNEGRWQKVLNEINPGDYVVIQFGHNDEKTGADRHTDPGSTFDAYLTQYVNETRARGGIPVLMNSVVRLNFFRQVDTTVDDESLRNTTYSDETINSDTLVDTHGAYRDVPRQLAKTLGVAFVDANQITHDLEQSMGVIGSRKLHMWYKPGEVASIPEGRHDNTHYNVYGARRVAALLSEALAKVVPALATHVVHYDVVVSAQGRGNFMQLKDAVSAAPYAAEIYVLDGSWTVSKKLLREKKLRLRTFPGATVRRIR